MRRGVTVALTAPSVGLVAGLLLAPMALLFVVSFWSVVRFRLTPGFGVAAWWRVADAYGLLTLYTLGVGVVVALVCTTVGFLFAYVLRFHAGRHAEAMLVATMIALFGGYLVKIYAWKSLLSADGLINRLLIATGLRDTPAPWLIFNRGAVVVALVNFLLPFAVLPIFAALRNVSPETLAAGRDLGASPIATIIRVVIPQCRSGLFAAFAFTFLLAAGDYVTPMFLGGASGSMLGQFIAQEFSVRFNWPAGAAMSFTLLFSSLGLLALVWRFLFRGRG